MKRIGIVIAALGLVLGAQAARIVLLTTVTQGAANAGTGAMTYPNLSFTEPAGYSLAYAGWAAFDPPVSGGADAGAPVIAEWTRQADGGDTIAMTAEGTATAFMAYSPGYTSASTIALAAGRQYAITLPTLATDDMHLLWPQNGSGYGTPAAINRTELWWAGPDTVSRGETVSLYGRNLQLGTGDSYLYCEEAPSTNLLTSATANPYKTDFVIPESWTNGTYTIYAHNGHGRKYGWSDALTLTVATATDWSLGGTYNVVTYGADSTGVTNSEVAIENAIQAASDDANPSKVYFPPGTYGVSGKITKYGISDVYIYGDDAATTIIQPLSDFAADSDAIFDTVMNNGIISNLTIKSKTYGGGTLIRSVGGDGLLVTDCILDQYETTAPQEFMEMSGIEHLTIRNCTMTLSSSLSIVWGARQVFLENNELIGSHDANTLISVGRTGNETREIALIGNTARHYDENAAETSTSAFCKGRFVHGNHGWFNFYASDNVTSNLSPRTELPDKNEGEHYMYEFAYTHQALSPSAINGANLTFSSMHDYDSDPAWNSGTTYNANDVVRYNNKSWISDSGGNLNHTPSTGSSWWNDLFPDNMTIIIQDGQGLGQHRTILGVTNKVVTVDKAFDPQPSVSSVLAMGTYAKNVAIYNNKIDGRGVYVDTVEFRADYALLAYGGAVNLIFDSNDITDLRFGATLQSRHSGTEDYDGVTYYMTQPHFFTMVSDNTFTNTRYALSTVTARKNNDVSANPYYYPNTMGNTFRRNIVNDAYNGIRFGGTYSSGWNEIEHLDFHIWQGNTFTNFTSDIIAYSYQTSDLSHKEQIDANEVYNQVFVNNITNNVSWSP